jgi:hypothetical protein
MYLMIYIFVICDRQLIYRTHVVAHKPFVSGKEKNVRKRVALTGPFNSRTHGVYLLRGYIVIIARVFFALRRPSDSHRCCNNNGNTGNVPRRRFTWYLVITGATLLPASEAFKTGSWERVCRVNKRACVAHNRISL